MLVPPALELDVARCEGLEVFGDGAEELAWADVVAVDALEEVHGRDPLR